MEPWRASGPAVADYITFGEETGTGSGSGYASTLKDGSDLHPKRNPVPHQRDAIRITACKHSLFSRKKI